MTDDKRSCNVYRLTRRRRCTECQRDKYASGEWLRCVECECVLCFDCAPMGQLCKQCRETT
jgi:hypothetical protein